MPKTGCSLDPEVLKELLQDHAHALNPLSFSSSAGWEAVHNKYCSFFALLLEKTRSLNKDCCKLALPERFSKSQKEACAGHLVAAFSDLLRKQRNHQRYSTEPRKSVYRVLFKVPQKEKEQEPPQTPPRRLKRKTSWPPVDLQSELAVEVVADGTPAEEIVSSPGTVASSNANEPAAAVELIAYSKTLANSGAAAPVSPVQGTEVAVPFNELPAWWDSRELKMCTLCPRTGNKVFGEVALGAKGFLDCTWPDGSRLQTSVSNLALAMSADGPQEATEVLQAGKPAALKRPAAAQRGKPAAAPTALAAAAPNLLAAAEGAAVAPAPAVLLHAQAEDAGAAAASSLLEPAAKKGKKAAKPGVEPVLRLQHPLFGPCQTYRGPDKAYIQYRDGATGRWLSVVNFSKGPCRDNHKDFCTKVFAALPGFGSMSSATEMKDQLIAALP